MQGMTIHYAYFCDDCGLSTPKIDGETCARCGSPEITCAPCYASVDYDDVADAKRLAEIRADTKPVWDAMDKRMAS